MKKMLAGIIVGIGIVLGSIYSAYGFEFTFQEKFTVEEGIPFGVLKTEPVECMNFENTTKWLNDRGLQYVQNTQGIVPEGYGMFTDPLTNNTAVLFTHMSDSNDVKDALFCLFAYGVVQTPGSLGR